ncbi:hypothetical protein D3C84_785780 [compost metagenome]
MQQRRFAGIGGEVVTVLDPDIDIRNAQQRQQGADVEPDQVDRRQDEGASDHRRQQHRRQRRHDAVDAALIKALQRERIALDLGKHLGRDQEPGDDKEDVNADEAAGQQAGLEVMQQHCNHCDSAQPINVGAVFALSHAPDHP